MAPRATRGGTTPRRLETTGAPRRRRGLALLSLLALLCGAPAHAQEVALVPLPAALGDAPRRAHAPTARPGRIDDGRPDPAEAGADLRLHLTLPSWRFTREEPGALLRQVTLTRLPPGSLLLRRDGIDGLVTRKIVERLRAAWSDSLDHLWQADTIDLDGLRDARRTMGEAFEDERNGGRWWERTWWELLPPERGGAPHPVVYTLGEQIEVLRLGPLALSNDLRLRVDRFSVSLDPDQSPVLRSAALASRLGLARDHAHLSRDPRGGAEDDGVVAAPGDPVPADVPVARIMVDAPEMRRGLSGMSMRLRLRPAARVNLLAEPGDIVRDLSLRAAVDVSRRPGLPPFLRVEAQVRWTPGTNDVRVGVEVALLAW